MILKKFYISRGGGVKANLEKVYILIFFFLMASLRHFSVGVTSSKVGVTSSKHLGISQWG